MDALLAAKSAFAALGVAREAYEKMPVERLGRLFSAAGKKIKDEDGLDDETTWKILEASLDSGNAEKIFQAAQKASLADSILAVSLMGILLGDQISKEPLYGSSYSKVLRALMSIQDDELDFVARCAAVSLDLQEVKFKPSEALKGAAYPEDLTLVGPGTLLTKASGISFNEQTSEMLISLKKLQLGHPRDAHDYFHLSKEALVIGSLYRSFMA